MIKRQEIRRFVVWVCRKKVVRVQTIVAAVSRAVEIMSAVASEKHSASGQVNAATVCLAPTVCAVLPKKPQVVRKMRIVAEILPVRAVLVVCLCANLVRRQPIVAARTMLAWPMKRVKRFAACRKKKRDVRKMRIVAAQ